MQSASLRTGLAGGEGGDLRGGERWDRARGVIIAGIVAGITAGIIAGIVAGIVAGNVAGIIAGGGEGAAAGAGDTERQRDLPARDALHTAPTH